MINDGYGEQYDYVEDAILERERLIRLQVAERTRNREQTRNDWDDLLNEARIVVWEVLEKRPEAPGAYINASTAKRVTECLMRGVWTGMEGHRGREIDPIRRGDRDSFDDPLFSVEASAPDVLDTVLLAYHEGEIAQAIQSLPLRHQRYVILRFWYGLSHVEMAEAVGIKPGNMARMWTEQIQPVLAERLEHLTGVS